MGKGKRSNTGVQQLNFGDNCYSGQDIIHGWTRYFCDLSTPDYTVEEACKPTHPGDENYQGLEHLFNSRELHTAISALKPAKASGPDKHLCGAPDVHRQQHQDSHPHPAELDDAIEAYYS